MIISLNENFERLKKLKAKLEFVPPSPGVYIHKNQKNEILYVGKAKNLRSRLKSYFTSFDQHTLKTKALVEKIYDFEVIVAESEYESLLLENNLIKHNLPPYNILLRDDKTYPYIKIDLKEEWPRVILTRRRKKEDALYFGPYTLAGQAHQIMNVIHRFFPLVKCTPNVFKSVSRPCNYYDIKKCLGPCKLSVDKNEYNLHLQNTIAILEGKSEKIAEKIKAEMQKSADNLNFEKAAYFRDQYKSLFNLNYSQSVALDIPLFIDIMSATWSESCVVFYVTFIRNGKLVGGNSFVVKDIFYEPEETEKENHQEKIVSSFICQFYAKKEVPDFVFISQSEKLFSIENYQNIQLYLTKQKSQDEKLYTNLQYFYSTMKKKYKLNDMKKYKKIFSDMIQLTINNAENKFQEQIKIDESALLHLEDLKTILNLKALPVTIECYDISTFQGAQTVASQVVFKHAKPHKSSYRKYILKENIGKTDDFASLREVIRRRFKNRDQLPHLMIIDGGTPQIREVGWILKSLGLEHIPFVGLAKSRVKNLFNDTQVSRSQERIVVPKRNEIGELFPGEPSETIPLMEGTPAFRLLTQLRDEAHRFAIEFHRKKRDAFSIQSNIFETSGLGPLRKKKLLEFCPNLKDILTLNLSDLSKKCKIPLNILLEIKEKVGKL